jgi:hypothetical protein
VKTFAPCRFTGIAICFHSLFFFISFLSLGDGAARPDPTNDRTFEIPRFSRLYANSVIEYSA